LNEAWGITIIEAGKFGVPIVASSVGGIPYFAGGYVLLVPPKNEAKLKEAIKKILENEELRKILSEKSYELSQKYTKDSMIKRYLELYLSLYKVKNS
jgi:glycosyltransferase involved in cell wall biosynthesis